jgi:hypothetical protein
MMDSDSSNESDGTTSTNGHRTNSRGLYSLSEGTKKARQTLLSQLRGEIPTEILGLIDGVGFKNQNQSLPLFPCPFKETEAIGALKSVEAGLAAAIADSIHGRKRQRKTEVDLGLASCFLFSTYLATIGGYGKADPRSKVFLKCML